MKTKLLFLLLVPMVSFSQIQIGEDIDGRFELAQTGETVGLSADGSIVAIGASIWNSSGVGRDNGTGHVLVFKNVSGVWTQIGNDINGEADFIRFGRGLSLSSDGSILAVGAPWYDTNESRSVGQVTIFENQSDVWIKIGEIYGEAHDDRLGEAISLSSDGSILAIGARYNDGTHGRDSGHVRIYRNSNGNWVQIGSDIDGKDGREFFGYGIDLSSDGSIVAIGGTGNKGRARIYRNIEDKWVQIGGDIEGRNISDNFGRSISLSSDGSIVAIGTGFNPFRDEPGYACIYRNESGEWVQIGNDIHGEVEGDVFGRTISLSSDGSIVAIGAPYKGGASGQVRIFKNINNEWIQIGNDINGEAPIDYFAWEGMDLSSDGAKIAIGAILNDGGGENSGHVRVFDLSQALSNNKIYKDYFSLYPNPAKNQLKIKLSKGTIFKQASIYNTQSQFLFSTKKQNIDVSNLNSGLYFVEVETDQGKSIKKVVIE